MLYVGARHSFLPLGTKTRLKKLPSGDPPEFSLHLHSLELVDVGDQLVVGIVDQPELDRIAALKTVDMVLGVGFS
jgi:hypothetical protein